MLICILFLNYSLMQLQRMVEEEELQFHEDYINEQDPSILHFLLASGDDVCHISNWKFLLAT